MHELLLYGQVPQARHEQVLKVLAGLAGMQPTPLLKRHILYKPLRDPEEPGSHLRRGGTQAVAVKNTVRPVGQKPLYYTQLAQQLSEDDFEGGQKHRADGNSLEVHDETGNSNQWSWEWHDLPDPVDRGVLVRQTTSSGGIDGNAHAYMTGIGNQFVSEFYVEGHRFVLENVVIYLHRVLHEPGVRSLETEPKQALPTFSALEPLDPSGTYILEAKIRLQDLNNPAVLDMAIQELLGFKKHMKGCVELHVPDRLTMDTRVKYQLRRAGPQTQQAVNR